MKCRIAHLLALACHTPKHDRLPFNEWLHALHLVYAQPVGIHLKLAELLSLIHTEAWFHPAGKGRKMASVCLACGIMPLTCANVLGVWLCESVDAWKSMRALLTLAMAVSVEKQCKCLTYSAMVHVAAQPSHI